MTPKRLRSHCLPSRLQNSGAWMECRRTCAHPAGAHPALVVVAAVLHETLVLGVRHRSGVDVEGVHLAPVRRAFVVQCPRLVGGAHGERAAGDEDFGRAGEQRGRFRVGGGQGLGALAELMGDQHRLVMLLFVLRDHPEGESGLGEPGPVERGALQDVQHPAAYLSRVAPGLRGRQQGQRGAFGARVLEGVVDAVDLGPYRLLPGDGPQQPLLLLVADVGEVPHERRHERRVLGGQVGVLHTAGEEGRAVPGGDQCGHGPLADGLGVDGGVDGRVGHVRISFPSEPCVRSSRSSAGHRPRIT
ncbi:UNVERIFIED_CONTAM: hypothetical protein RKD50_008062 [Streptomyces canus]